MAYFVGTIYACLFSNFSAIASAIFFGVCVVEFGVSNDGLAL